MNKNDTIYIAGHKGLVGSAIHNQLKRLGYTNIICKTHSELDLEDAEKVKIFFDQYHIDYVFLAAAFVGGIVANNTMRADFIYRNLAIQQNVIYNSYRTKVKKLLFLGSTCIYPREAPQPMKEDCLLTSELEYTNEPYAIAKIAGLKMCESFNIQYGTNFIACMPTNLYGPNDNFDLIRGHVLPVIIRKIYLAKLLMNADYEAIKEDFIRRPQPSYNFNIKPLNGCVKDYLSQFGIYSDHITLWGTGNPMREFLWSEDMADACVFLMQKVNFNDLVTDPNYIKNCHINIGTGEEISIKELSDIVKNTIGYTGEILFDNTHPDGTPRKLTDPTKINQLGWRYHTNIYDGVHQLYQHYISSH